MFAAPRFSRCGQTGFHPSINVDTAKSQKSIGNPVPEAPAAAGGGVVGVLSTVVDAAPLCLRKRKQNHSTPCFEAVLPRFPEPGVVTIGAATPNPAQLFLFMANLEHLALQGTAIWNDWRRRKPEFLPDLSEANLAGADLSEANLGGRTSDRQTSSRRISAGHTWSMRTSAGRNSAERTSAGRNSARRTSAGRISVGRTSAGRTSAGRTSAGRTSAGRISAGRTSAMRNLPGRN